MLLSVASYGQAINSVPFTISQPGNYFLNKNLVFTSPTGNAITINSSNVNLDFAGHVLFGLDIEGTQAIGVALAQNQFIGNVTIQNGTISGFRIGIDLGKNSSTEPNGHVVEGMRLVDNVRGINGGGVSGCLISNDFISGFKSDDGISVGTYCEVIRNRVVSFNIGVASFLAFMNGNDLESNFVSGCQIGFDSGAADKLRFNTTVNCFTPFTGAGTLITDDNN